MTVKLKPKTLYQIYYNQITTEGIKQVLKEYHSNIPFKQHLREIKHRLIKGLMYPSLNIYVGAR
nr:MAG TPA: hypothetical protein [Caudoviricetes sp.]